MAKVKKDKAVKRRPNLVVKVNKDPVLKAKAGKVWVCRGCCCGTRRKHPGVDHKQLEKDLRAGAGQAGLRYEVTDCLGPCGQGNIVVTRTEGRIRWYRRMNDHGATAVLVRSLGNPSGAGVPAELDRHLMRGRAGKKP